MNMPSENKPHIDCHEWNDVIGTIREYLCASS